MGARLDMCRCHRSQRRSLSVVARDQGATDDIAMATNLTKRESKSALLHQTQLRPHRSGGDRRER
jgi:hypothetical protein